MSGHGPDAATYDRFSREETAPVGPIKMSKNDLAFMFESTYMLKLTEWANQALVQQTQYYECWMPLKAEFDETAAPTPAGVEDKSNDK